MCNFPKVTELSNGFRVITYYMHGVDSVALNVWVGVGSRYEKMNQNNGISHFLEHMAFKGTKKRTAFEIAKAFDDIGGIFNASTGRESTNYYAKVLGKDIKIGVDILMDILTNSVFPENELEREKNVVIQEIFQVNDSPSDMIFDKYFEVAYNNQSFGKSILGTEDTVKLFTSKHLNDYMNKYYSTKNMIFSAAGNVNHEEVVKLVKIFFSNTNMKDVAKDKLAEFTGGEYLEYRKLQQINLLIGFPSVSYYDNKYQVFQVLNSILGVGISSRLFQKIREKHGLVYSIYSFNYSYCDTGILSIFASTDKTNLKKLIDFIIIELKELSNNITNNEVNRVKERIKSQILMSREDVNSCAELLGYYYGNYKRYITKSELIEKINEVTTYNVKKSAESLLSQYKKFTLAAVGEIEFLPSYDKIISILKS